jgi:Tfp pilus assembly protein PilF
MFPAYRRSISLLILTTTLCALAAGCGGAQARKVRHLEKGEAFLAAGNLDKARIEIQNALQIDPKDAQARYDMGVIDEKRGDPRAAAQAYQGAIELNPDLVAARVKLARLYLFSAGAEQALDLIKPAIIKHPDDPALLTVRAAARIQQKDASGALADGERAVALAPTNEDAVSVLAGIYKSQGDATKAEALLEKTLQAVPGSIDLRLVLAQLYAQESRPADVEAQLLKIFELAPKDKASRVRLAQFYARTDQADAAEKVLRQAIKDMPDERDLKLSLIDFLATRRSRELAETELKQMIAAAPGDNELKFALAGFYQGGKEPQKAEAVYREVIAREGTNSAGLAARDRYASLRLQANDAPGALALANEVLAASPRDDDALLIRGTIALSNQDPRSAIADMRAVLRDQPNAIGVLRTLARAHLANGEPAVAEETLRHAVEANPQDAALRLDFAELLAQIGKPEQAKALLAELVKAKPDNFEAVDAQFRVAMGMNDLVTAKSAADAVVAMRPKLGIGYMYEGMVAEAEKRPDEALRVYRTAADLQPNAAEPLEAVVRLLAAAKRLPEALRVLDDATQKYPDSSFALTIKGELLMRAGRNDEAKQAFQAALERTPKWWAPYRGLANVQVAEKDDLSIPIATLRKGKSVAEQPESLSVQLAGLLEAAGKPEEAISEYEEILHGDPKSEIAANNLAMLLATYRSDAHSLDRAKELSARFVNSTNPSYLDTYGWVLFKRGDAADSVPVLSRVVDKVPDAPVARYHLGMAQSLAGDVADARTNLQRAINAGSRFNGLDEARSTLQKLGQAPAPVSGPKS